MFAAPQTPDYASSCPPVPEGSCPDAGRFCCCFLNVCFIWMIVTFWGEDFISGILYCILIWMPISLPRFGNVYRSFHWAAFLGLYLNHLPYQLFSPKSNIYLVLFQMSQSLLHIFLLIFFFLAWLLPEKQCSSLEILLTWSIVNTLNYDFHLNPWIFCGQYLCLTFIILPAFRIFHC